ncbi:hypothetical protein BV25DRAFT_1846382 [Artomyces pyxidatus]|uniref:Uncharacterized protein n=1 Tax=Artomyces pyxidatus TaxID=48021 RepID=A0ACB8TIZ2_9AGAM|nr:hypothetical protein BV25DRAFT_1846382 [Artomyces pyxidatus]
MSVLRLTLRSSSSCFHHRSLLAVRFYTHQPAMAPVASSSTDSTQSGGEPHDSFNAGNSAAPPATQLHTVERSNSKPKATARRQLAPSQTKLYLETLYAGGIQPSLSDLERLKPLRHPRPDNPIYATEYMSLLNALCRSFTSDQLRDFAIQYNLGLGYTGSKRRKSHYAEAIMEQAWQWPSLRELERKRIDRTVVITQTFPLSPSELFIVLGKDGADLLNVSKAYNVHVSLTDKPLALRVEGVRDSLKRVEEHLLEIKKSILDESFVVPSKKPVRQDLLQRISRIVGAFMENIDGEGKVRICAKDATSLLAGSRLAARAASGIEHTTLLAHRVFGVDEHYVPSVAPARYALFPFLSPRPLPWMINAQGVFRWRRVADWLGLDHGKDLHQSEGLAAQRGDILTVDGTKTDLRSALMEFLPQSPMSGSNRTITASTGHIVFTSTVPDRKFTLQPPLSGTRTFSTMLKWISGDRSAVSFIPSLPPHLTNARPLQQNVLHRLVYQALRSRGEGRLFDQTPRSIQFEMTLTQSSPRVLDGVSEEQSPSTSLSRCWISHSKDIDLMLPDRYMDLRLTVTDSASMNANEEPIELQKYAAALREYLSSSDAEVTQPTAPLTLHLNEEEYLLVNSASVRQSRESIPSLDATQINATSESILDLESSQKHATCLFSCDAFDAKEDWDAFLTNCDRLTATAYTSRQAPTLTP